ncbi:regulator of telomere elongation helicase 1 homolog isoform X1 [Neodiprion lecontei]|uniref:Regulator of telomere elongation helicase 1 homolog n=1 Tax=Neodiprion lecontei TaxID=441921 RepID=A0A6J0BLI5_NEOLC|nr:regulator of telomere elongation helicase 1 homolog isoform X1 [Neodiprion lecontei]
MPDINLNGIIVTFPFEPYDVQKRYMEKVIECLQNAKHGVLESPTGTGKTLCLLCSSLSWLLVKKAQLQSEALMGPIEKPAFGGEFFEGLTKTLEKAAGKLDQSTNFSWGMPKIIYASRTHSQLSQAMQELKKTSYKHVKVAVIGSRDQLCIHPEVSKETNSATKIHMCQSKVKSRTCHYYNNVDARKLDPIFGQEILDIEDLVKTGQKLRCCPYFLSKELKQSADITFMPYNYILDPKTRKAQGLELQNNILLLDEAHNVEKTCEESASLQISSTDIAICIDEITTVMKDVADEASSSEPAFDTASGSQKDFTPEDLCILKAMFLEFEKAIDSIEIKKKDEGETFPGGYIFELLEKAELTQGKETLVIDKLDKIVLYLSTTSTSPFSRKGNGLQKFNDLLRVVFSGGQASPLYRDRVKRCYKVHVMPEEVKKGRKNDGWDALKTTSKTEGKIISYWCFSPGFGMQQIVEQGIRSIVLTSGTLSPLKPLISELAIPIGVQLENPHIVTGRQVCVGVLSNGPDGHPLNSSFNTRNDPKYIASLGRTIYNFSCLIPHGMLVFFPSYPILKKCQEEWQNSGLWTKICERKPIYVEGQLKHVFINTMNEYYEKIQDPSCKGAIFMAVCRGKVSEGLDFADMNGRAVLVTGLPFPPLKDPRVILKQKYLEESRSRDKESLTGQQWYQLEASRAVNQAIGRVIRHKNDYGAIILCDCRFENPGFRKQLSAWLQPHIKKFTNFGMITKDLREFFRAAERDLPQPNMKEAATMSSLDFFPRTSDGAFGETHSRIANPGIKQERSVPSVVIDDFSIDKYTETKPTKWPITEGNEKDIFKLLETKSKPVIDFSNCKLKTDWTRCELTKDVEQPIAKKRKIHVVGVKLDALPQPSTSVESPSANIEVQTHTKNGTALKKAASSEKKEIGTVYLKEVKRSLTKENYKIFSVMIQNYTKNADYDQLLKTLEFLFPKTNNLRHLFKGFRSFLKKQHNSDFDSHIRLLERLEL